MFCNCTLPYTNPAACENCSNRQQFYGGFGVSEFNTTIQPYNERLFDKPPARRGTLLRRQRNKRRGK